MIKRIKQFQIVILEKAQKVGVGKAKKITPINY
jgi:hypothetical protein